MVNSAKIHRELEDIILKFPDLNALEEHDFGFRITGSISVIDSNAWNWGIYQVVILVPKTFPQDLPLLIETAGSIRREIDWHVNIKGVCCVGTPSQQHRVIQGQQSVLAWINLFAVPFLANHAFKVENGKYVDGEMAHGVEGIFQDYSLLFNLCNTEQVIKRVKEMLGISRLSLNAECFCGSGQKYKRCFVQHVSLHQYGIPTDLLKKDLKMLIEFSKLQYGSIG